MSNFTVKAVNILINEIRPRAKRGKPIIQFFDERPGLFGCLVQAELEGSLERRQLRQIFDILPTTPFNIKDHVKV